MLWVQRVGLPEHRREGLAPAAERGKSDGNLQTVVSGFDTGYRSAVQAPRCHHRPTCGRFACRCLCWGEGRPVAKFIEQAKSVCPGDRGGANKNMRTSGNEKTNTGSKGSSERRNGKSGMFSDLLRADRERDLRSVSE